MTPYEHHRRDTGATGAHSRILSLLVGEGRQRSARAVPSRCPLFTVRFTDVEQYKKVVYKRDTKEFLPKAMVFFAPSLLLFLPTYAMIPISLCTTSESKIRYL